MLVHRLLSNGTPNTNRPADGLVLPLPRLADDGGRRKVEPGLALVVDGGGGTNLMSGGDRSPPLVVLSPRFSATTCGASMIRIAGITDSDRSAAEAENIKTRRLRHN